MQRKQIIKLAEEAGLLFNEDVAPYNHPAQQRLISKLEKFPSHDNDPKGSKAHKSKAGATHGGKGGDVKK